MANVNSPLGFVPRRHRYGGVERANAYKIQAAYATALFTGDAVLLTSGYVVKGLENSSVILGILAGVQYQAADGSVVFQPNWVASTATLGSADVTAWVWDDPGIIYRVQASVGTAYVDATHKGGSYDLIATNAGVASSGRSGMELNLGDTGTGQFQVLGLIDEVGNAAGTNAKLEVVIRKALLAQN